MNALYRVSDSYRTSVGSGYVQANMFPSVLGSEIRIDPNPSHLLQKGPNWHNDPYLDYRIHCLVHSDIGENENLDYTRWHQRDGNHLIFRLFLGSENLWGDRLLAARVEAFADSSGYISSDIPEWHSFEVILFV